MIKSAVVDNTLLLEVIYYFLYTSTVRLMFFSSLCIQLRWEINLSNWKAWISSIIWSINQKIARYIQCKALEIIGSTVNTCYNEKFHRKCPPIDRKRRTCAHFIAFGKLSWWNKCFNSIIRFEYHVSVLLSKIRIIYIMFILPPTWSVIMENHQQLGDSLNGMHQSRR